MAHGNIVFLTIDALRFDALEKLPQIRNWMDQHDAGHAKAICNSSGTKAVFPSILASQYHFEAYDNNGELKKEIRSLPSILSQAGYTTGAFIASNPYLSMWESDFDFFLNPDPKNDFQQIASLFDDLLNLKKRVLGEDLLNSGFDWFNNQDLPRFLWVHLMEPHTPYHPGFRDAWEIGIMRSYLASLRYHIALYQERGTSKDIHPKWKKQLRRLYWKCVEKTDRIVSDFLERLPPETTVIILGDHGENLTDDPFNHSTLSEACVTTPCFIRWNLTGEFELPDVCRQIDISPTIANGAGLDVPDQWEGEPYPKKNSSTSVVNMSVNTSRLGKHFIGRRSKSRKLVLTFDPETRTEVERTWYDINDNQSEQEEPEESRSEFANQTEKFSKRFYSGSLFSDSQSTKGEKISKRLRQLGYLSE